MTLRLFVDRVFAQTASWVRGVVGRGRLEAEMDAELASHLAALTDDLVRAGHQRKEAARRARIALGAAMVHKEGMRASLGLRWWDEFWTDLRHGFRVLCKSPGFTAIAANSTIFSAAKQILYERLGVPHAAELRLLRWTGTERHVVVHHVHGDYDHLPGGRVTSPVFSYPVYQQLRAQNSVLGDLLAFRETGMNATIGEDAERVLGEMVSGNYYAVLGV